MALPKANEINLDDVFITKDTNPGAQFTIIYGKGDVGKTSVAIYSDAPVIIPVGTERNHKRFPVHKMENVKGKAPLLHLFECMHYLATKEHSRKTVIIDNLSEYRKETELDVVSTFPVKEGTKAENFGDFSYGKGQAYAFNYYTRLIAGIDKLLDKGLHVILIAHESAHTVNLPDGSYYHEIGVYAPTGDKTNVKGLLEAKANNILYLTAEAQTRNVKGIMGVDKKIATNRQIDRVIYTKQTGRFFAKTKSNLPKEIEVPHCESFEDLVSLKNPVLINLFEELYK